MSGHSEVKFEAYTEFEKSAFCDVYRNAYYVVNDIIEENAQRNAKYKGTGEYFCNEKHINNVISFLGGRGMGKSSAMLSFAYFLKMYEVDNEKTEFPTKYRFINVTDTLGFHVLPKIDAAMLKTEESLFDVILAKMWDEFFEKYNDNTLSKEYSYNQTKAKFSAVRKSYALYRQNSDKKERGISEITELHDLAQSLNLREDFSNLVEAFLRCMHKESDNKYMVIPIDDIDLVSEEAYHKLEQIRVFFTIPNVIVLITADINRLVIDMKGMLSNRLLSEHFGRGSGDEQYIQEYIQDYLSKVLPQNMRMYMPFCNRIEPKALGFEYSGKYIQKIYGAKYHSKEKIDENKFIMIILAKYAGLLIYAKGNEFPVAGNSIRNIANRWEELCNIIDKRRKPNALYQWIRKELIIYNDYIEDGMNRKLANEMLLVPDEKYNYELLVRLHKEKRAFTEFEQNHIGYGRVLKTLIQMKQEEQYDSDLLKMLLWNYTLILLEGIDNGEDINKNFVKNDIFASLLSDLGGTIFSWKGNEEVRDIEIRVNWGETIKDIYEKNYDKLQQYFSIFMMCDIKEIYKNYTVQDCRTPETATEKKTDEMKFVPPDSYLAINIKMKDLRFSFERYILNMLDYQNLWAEYIRWILGEIRKLLPNKSIMMVPHNKRGDVIWEKIFKWKTEYEIEKMWDIIPLQYVSIMMEVIQKLQIRFPIKMARSISISGQEIVIIVETMIEVLEEVEKFYDLPFMVNHDADKKKMIYSAKLKGLLEIIRMQNFDIRTLHIWMPRVWGFEQNRPEL